MITHIDSVPVDAPIFQGVPAEVLLTIIDKLSKASYHYADDTGHEWGRAGECVREAAALINQHKLRYDAIRHLHAHEPQLVMLSTLIDVVLKDLRK